MHKRNGRLSVMIVTILILVMAFAPACVYASTSDELKGVKEKKTNVYEQIEEQQKKVEAQQAEINKIQGQITTKTQEVEATQAEIEETKKQLEERKEGLEARVRVMYKTGSVGFIDVLLSSRSFSELQSNIDLVKRIYQEDQDALEKITKAEEKLEKQEAKLKEEKAALDEQKESLSAKKAVFDKELGTLQSQFKELEQQEAKLEKELQEEIAKAAAQNPAPTGGTTGGNNGGNTASLAGKGMFNWPVSGTITAGFGPRGRIAGLNTSSFHRGIDIAVSYGTPVRAAASGTVITAAGHWSYGNYVVINHGNGYTTLYAHNSRLAVHVGQTVSQGDVIAYAGSTGQSSGTHCHFEIRINGGAVSPLSYL